MSERGSTQVEEALDALERLAQAAVGWPNADYEDDRVVADAEIVRELLVRSALRERAEGEPDADDIKAVLDACDYPPTFAIVDDHTFEMSRDDLRLLMQSRKAAADMVRRLNSRSPLTSTTGNEK